MDKHPNKSEKTFIVLGAPRTGTSMVAGILNRLDIDMGNFRGKDGQNPNGYYEDKDFLKLIDDIFHSIDSTYHGFKGYIEGDFTDINKELQNRAKKLINKKQKNKTKKYWGWKTTGSIFTLDYFLPYLNDPHFVIIFRNPKDMAISSIEYTKAKNIFSQISFTKALDVYSFYYDAIIDFLQNHSQYPTLFLSYSDIINCSQTQTQKICEFADIKYDAEVYKNIDGFIKTPKQLKRDKNYYYFKELLRKYIRKFKNKINEILI